MLKTEREEYGGEKGIFACESIKILIVKGGARHPSFPL